MVISMKLLLIVAGVSVDVDTCAARWALGPEVVQLTFFDNMLMTCADGKG